MLISLSSGCVTTTTSRVNDSAKSGRHGVEIGVYKDGTVTLYGNPIDKGRLSKRLKKEERAHEGRAVILKAKGGATRSQLADLRNFLVLQGIPNVTVVTTLNAKVEEGEAANDLEPRHVSGR